MTENEKYIELFIDDKPVSVPQGTTILKAAEMAGIYIPHYCYHPALSIVGSCRLCLVEIHSKGKDGVYRKLPKLQISCQIPAAPDTKVYTNTPEVQNAREGMMEFLLANHPLDCPICDRGGECMLQRYSMEHGIGKGEFFDIKRRFPKPQFDALIDLERNRCILCTRCVRFCHEIIGRHVFGLFERGSHTRIGTYKNKPVPTYFSGNVIDLCPVGALTSKPFRFKARNWELLQVFTTCALCSSGCPITLWMRDGKVYRTTPPLKKSFGRFAINEDTTEFICNFGRFGNDFGRSDERIKYSLNAENGQHRQIKYDEALNQASLLLKNVIQKYGKESIGITVSPRLTCEDLFAAQYFCKNILGTNNIDWRGNFANKKAVDSALLAIKIADVPLSNFENYKKIILLNTDLYNQSPITALQLKEAARKNNSEIILLGHVVDSWLKNFTKNIFYTKAEETDIFLNYCSQYFSQSPEQNTSIAKQTAEIAYGTENLKKFLSALSKIKESEENVLLIFSPEECSGIDSFNILKAIVSFKNIFKGKAKLAVALSSRNGLGALVTGYQNDSDNGITLTDMVESAINGSIKAMIVFGADELIHFPQRRKLLKALDNLDVLITADIFPSFISQKANLIFPIVDFDEDNGTMIDNSWRFARLTKGARPYGESKSVRKILFDLAEKLGVSQFEKSPDDVFLNMMKHIQPECPYTLENKTNLESVCPKSCKLKDSEKFKIAGGKYSYNSSNISPICKVNIHDDNALNKINEIKNKENRIAVGKDEFICTWCFNLTSYDHRLSRSETLSPLAPKPILLINKADAIELSLCENSKVFIDIKGRQMEFSISISDEVSPRTIRIQGITSEITDFILSDEANHLPIVKLIKKK